MNSNNFDPNAVGKENSGIFGLNYTPDEGQVVLIPAPWGVTVSYGGGTHEGPRAILAASPQIDYHHSSYGSDTWKLGISMLPLEDFQGEYLTGVELREKATHLIERLTSGEPADEHALKTINDECAAFHERIEEVATGWLDKGKLVGLVGGDHSTPLGLMRALAKKYGDFGILQIDAHCDLRDAYEGFTYSHASIMFNALKTPEIKRLVQVGIRDYSPSEFEIIENSRGLIKTYFDADLQARQFLGETWSEIVSDIVGKLPDKVYLSFDIDGLEPSLCPHTGTPVPGGLRFQEALFLIESVAKSGRTIIGFDVNEVSPSPESEWDANVGMRVLWNAVLWAAKSNGIEPVA